MEKSIVEKFSRKGRDFIIILFEKGDGSFKKEVFEIKQKIDERDLFDINYNDALTEAKKELEIMVETKS